MRLRDEIHSWKSAGWWTFALAVIFAGMANWSSGSTADLAPGFINFGYIQEEASLPYVNWNALTHVSTEFVDFDANGALINPSTFTNRNADLKSGGAASRAGVKVILVVRNHNFDESILNGVMADPAKRTLLANAVANLLALDTYCQGVNFDFEFNWGSTTRDGISAFISQMRAMLPQGDELSIYTHAIYDGNKWNIPALTPNINYMLYSTYDWGTETVVRANSDWNSCLPYIHDYLEHGLPPEKMVLTWVSYNTRWWSTVGYGSTGGVDSNNKPLLAPQGFHDALYDTTLEPQFGGPFASTYVDGDEAEWYTYAVEGTNYTVAWDSPRSMEMKIRTALSLPSLGRKYDGVRLGGVGWWALWLVGNYSENYKSYSPIANASVSRGRYSPLLYENVQRALAPPGDHKYIFEAFEGTNGHWRDPNESPDTLGDAAKSSAISWMATPSPTGTDHPARGSQSLRLAFNFQSAPNRAFVRHEILNDVGDTTVTDVNAAICRFDGNTGLSALYYVSGNYSNRTLRMAVVDSAKQVEVSDPISLPAGAGWNKIEWDLTNTAGIHGWNTSEPNLLDGDGVLNTAGNGADDISFLGFILEGVTAGTGSIYFDDLAYEHANPGGRNYTINELRYNVNNSEFVEIAGPPGPFPSEMQLRFYQNVDGPVAPDVVFTQVNLGGYSIPPEGLFVAGDTGVGGTSGGNGMVPSGWGTADNIPNGLPGGVQLYDGTTGCVYDSMVYGAMGGLNKLMRSSTHHVTGEGFGWCGAIASGVDGAGAPYTLGRYPDGADTDINENDFSFMTATPGQSNGGSVSPNAVSSYDFSSVPGGLFQTYQHPVVLNPVSSGLPVSPDGGNAYRCIDVSGGGVVGVLGDKALGGTNGVDISGYVYVPSGGAAAQAIGVGICGTQGSAFFPVSKSSSGYESGYWLIYENASAVLNDGLAAHPGSFQFQWVTDDNMDSKVSTALGSLKSLASVSGAAGSWALFHLSINPLATAGQQLVCQVNGVDVYRGTIPAGGPTSGAVQFGFREFTGTIAANEGTWVDGVTIAPANSLARVNDYMLY